MDYLILAPPVCTPAEPPSGAFVLAAALAGRGYHTGLMDLSLVFFHRLLEQAPLDGVRRAARYLLDTVGYEPQQHRTATGTIHKELKAVARRYPGWTLSLMDIHPPRKAEYDPEALAALLATEEHPFRGFWEPVLGPILDHHRPRRVLISVAYLSQLAGAIDLARYLEERGVEATIGGSLPTSLEQTGQGFRALRKVFPRLETGDGSSLLEAATGEAMLGQLAWPQLLAEVPYLSARPVIPLPLSTGCFWGRCLFCPDRDMPFQPLSTRTLEGFLESIPDDLRARRPVLHLLDSALPPAGLRRLLPLTKQHQLDFYGFARPTRQLVKDGLLEAAAESGCLMLQLGVEHGSRALMQRYHKGLDPDEAELVLRTAAAAGIRSYVYLLFGLPEETDRERHRTLELLGRNVDAVDFLNLSLFNLPVHCELTERAAEFDIEVGDYPSDAAIHLYRPFTWRGTTVRAEARRFLNELRADPRIHPAVLRTPRRLRAAHMALMEVPGRRPA